MPKLNSFKQKFNFLFKYLFQTQIYGAWHDEGRITSPWFRTFPWRELSNFFVNLFNRDLVVTSNENH